MHLNRNHEVSTEICNSRLDFGKHLRTQDKTQLHERTTQALVLSESKIKYVTHKQRALAHSY